MANFQYSALDAKGEQTTGAVSAASEAEAIQQLRAKGLYPTQITEEGKTKGKGKAAPAKSKAAAKAKTASKGHIGGRINSILCYRYGIPF